VVSGTPATSAGSLGYFELARVVIGPYFEVAVNPSYGLTLGRQFNTLRARDGGAGLQVAPGYQYRKLEFTLGQMTANDRRALFDLAGYMGDFRDGVISLFPEQGDRDERDFTLNGRFAVIEPQAWEIVRRSERLVFEEN
jgi:hypothetical protein